MKLFRWFILRRIAHEPLRSATTVLGIALGIAVIIAIRLTNASSIAGFETALNTLAGRTSLEIVGAGPGLDERRLPDLLWLGEYGDLAPVVEGDLIVRQAGRPAERLRLLGIDVLRDRPFRDYQLLEWEGGQGQPQSREFLQLLQDPASAILAARFAEPRGLTVGSTLRVNTGDRIVPLSVRGLLKDEGPARLLDGRIVVMDIAAAQHALNRFGRIDRLEVRLRDGIAVDEAEAAIASRLPAGVTVQRPEQRGRQVERMLAAFQLNLTALSYVALLVGLFLVYNTVSVAVLSRRDEIGTLRSLGTTAGTVRTLFLSESAVFSIVGCFGGVLIGRLLTDATVALTSTTVTALYIATAAAPPSLGWREFAMAFGIGVPLSLAAALVPALEAARVPPVAAIRGADRIESGAHFPARALTTGALLLLAGGWLATLGPVGGLPLFGYTSAIVIVFAASFLVPPLLFAVAHAVDRPVRRFLTVADWLAVKSLASAVPRLSISVAALSVSLSMMIAIAIMVGSFRETVIYWVGQTLQADLFVSPGSRARVGAGDALSPEVVGLVRASPDVASVGEARAIEVVYGGTPIRVVATDLGVVLSRESLLFKAPEGGPAAARAVIDRDEVLASESFTIRHRLGVGDRVSLPTDRGPATFRIAAVYYDYSSDRGVLVMDGSTFARHFGNRPVATLTVYLRDGVSPEDARQRMLTAAGESHSLLVHTNRSLRTEVLRVFDSTFAITYALELIAIVVAILGVSGTLLTLILERRSELAMLRLVGTDRRQIRRMVVGEAVLIGAVSQALGLAAGLVLSLVLIYVINVQSFGWSIQFHVPTAFLVQSSLLMIVCAALAGLLPARRAAALTADQQE